MLGLCRVCRKAVSSWSTPSLIDGTEDVRWTHYVPVDYHDQHEAVPMRGVLDDADRVLKCAGCGTEQVQDGQGWHCPNPTCHFA